MPDVDNGTIIEDEDSEESPAPLKTRIVGLVIAAAVLAVLVLGYMHVTLSPVAPGQAPPAGHYPGPCWACHMVSESAVPADGE
jgi:hypothetical protein